MKKQFLYPLALSLFIFIPDQITKILVLRYLQDGPVEILPFFNLVLVWNPGISFGLFAQNGHGALFLAGLALVICLALIIWIIKQDHLPLRCAGAAVIGGALGNALDRLQYGAVVDFLDFHAWGWHYPAFNIADCAIVLGIAFILFDSLFWEPKRKEMSKHHEDKQD